MSLQRTKIVATLGPACEDADVLDKMIRAGMSVARINFAHGEPDQHRAAMERVRRAARKAARPIAVLGDIAGPKIRIGELRDGKVQLTPGQTIVLTARDTPGDASELGITEPRVLRDLRRGDPVFLADGTMELRVEEASATEARCRVETGGLLLPRKGVNLPRTQLRLPALTQKDTRDLHHAVKAGFDVLALSFVRTVADVRDAKRRIGRADTPLVAKIEKREAITHLSGILDVADGVMVARGDLGVETAFDEVPLLQKRIIRLANDVAKPVITATQMLRSMVEAPHPTRAEATDVANAILDGSDAVMLSEETAMGKYPVKVVETMSRIARRAETALDSDTFAARVTTAHFVAGAVSDAAVRVARDVRAKAIVTPTGRGATPRFVARLRPPVPILALTRRLQTARHLALTWGVEPHYVPKLGGLEPTLAFGLAEVRRLGWVRKGDRVVFTAGFPAGGPSSNLMTVQVA